MQELVSILIPCRNEEKYSGNCLESVLACTPLVAPDDFYTPEYLALLSAPANESQEDLEETLTRILSRAGHISLESPAVKASRRLALIRETTTKFEAKADTPSFRP